MKLYGKPGEFAFKALINQGQGWDHTSYYYFSLEDAVRDYPESIKVKWPAEEIEPGVIYIPDESELKDE